MNVDRGQVPENTATAARDVSNKPRKLGKLGDKRLIRRPRMSQSDGEEVLERELSVNYQTRKNYPNVSRGHTASPLNEKLSLIAMLRYDGNAKCNDSRPLMIYAPLLVISSKSQMKIKNPNPTRGYHCYNAAHSSVCSERKGKMGIVKTKTFRKKDASDRISIYDAMDANRKKEKKMRVISSNSRPLCMFCLSIQYY